MREAMPGRGRGGVRAQAEPCRAAVVRSSGSAASKRSVGTIGLASVAPTIDDWWVGFLDDTTATRRRCIRPAGTPAQSLARAYEAMTLSTSETAGLTRPAWAMDRIQ